MRRRTVFGIIFIVAGLLNLHITASNFFGGVSIKNK